MKGRKKANKTAGRKNTKRREGLFACSFWSGGNSLGKIEGAPIWPREYPPADIYLDFTGFNQKCFIGRAMQVRRRYVGGRSGKPQQAKSVTRLLRTNQNMGFLPKPTDNSAVDDFHRLRCNNVCHRLTLRHSALPTAWLLA